jgi:hypothetical protein
MYTLLELQSKTFGELKKIGYELNVLPADDRRRRQSWIDALVNINPPLLQLLEVSPAVEVDRVQEPIIETVEASPAAEAEQVQDLPIESKFGRIVYPRPAQEPIVLVAQNSPGVDVDRVQEVISQVAKTSPGVDVDRVQEVISQVAKTSPGVEVDRALSHKFLLCLKEGHNTLWYDGKNFICEKWSAKIYCKRGVGSAKHQLRCHPEVKRLGNLQVVENSPGVDVDRVQELIVPMAETSPGVEVDRDQDEIEQVPDNTPDVDPNEGPECFECFYDKFVEDGGFIKPCPRCSEPNLSHQRTQCAIAPVVKKDIEEEPDQNPILTGIALSDRFLARYSPPPQPEIVFTPDADGQLSLLDFEVEPVNEPPDPDDFDSMFAFWAAYDAWDKATDDNSEPLEVSLDSFSEWAPCPDDWYEPSEVSDTSLSQTKSSITSDFFIPTFDAWCDRSNRSDEPPDTGIFARLPKPKPPKFPPQAASWTQVGHKLDTSWTQVTQASRNYPETIPKLFHRVAAGSSTQPARSPPGGDAMF